VVRIVPLVAAPRRHTGGRVTSNAGALEHSRDVDHQLHVSGTIRDSMDDILNKVHEAGLTLKAGCGIGYESRLCGRAVPTYRAQGVYLRSAVVMDIYKDVFTVSRGRPTRRADGTFDIGHPTCWNSFAPSGENGRLAEGSPVAAHHDEFMKAVKRRRLEARVPLGIQEYEADIRTGRTRQFGYGEWPYDDGHGRTRSLVA